VNRLNSRIKELEDRLASSPPSNGVMLGERIGILLREAEEAAAEAITAAEARATQIIAEVEVKNAAAEDTVGRAVARAEVEARRIETQARGEAEEIVAEAEARAAARTRQIEQWAEQVVSHTRAEEARMLKEQQARQFSAAAELKTMADQKAEAASQLRELRDAIDRALELAHDEDVASIDPDIDPEIDPEWPVAAPVHANLDADSGDGAAFGGPTIADSDVDLVSNDSADSDVKLFSDDGAADISEDLAADDTGDVSVDDTGEVEVVEAVEVEVVEAQSIWADEHPWGPGDLVEDEEVAWSGPAREPADDFYPSRAEEPVTGEIELRDMPHMAGSEDLDDGLDTRIEAWVSGGSPQVEPKHFRRL
jgi:hypothetical protein